MKRGWIAAVPLCLLCACGGDTLVREFDKRRTFSVEVPEEWVVRTRVDRDHKGHETYLFASSKVFVTPEFLFAAVAMHADPDVPLDEWDGGHWRSLRFEVGKMFDAVTTDEEFGGRPARVTRCSLLAGGQRYRARIVAVREGGTGYVLIGKHPEDDDGELETIDAILDSFQVVGALPE